MAKVMDLINQRYGQLIVLKRIEQLKNGRIHWLCKCACGNVTTVAAHNLRSGMIKGCGCLIGKHSKGDANKTHGMSHTVEYQAWANMIHRCANPNNPRWNWYGGRGITVCKRWLNSFENFYEDMGKRPSRFHSIDRINNDGNYEPNNCRWTTADVQQRNKG